MLLAISPESQKNPKRKAPCIYRAFIFPTKEHVAMPRLPRAFNVQGRRDSGTFVLTLNPPSGLPLSVCAEWRRKSFAHLPDELALYRNPETKTAAENAAIALIQHLKERLASGAVTVSTETVKAGPWLERFISLDDNPRAARIMGEGYHMH
jgi:hypothetical protein